MDGSTDSQSFDISSSTGLLTTRLEFDREDQSSFSFEVIATDEADGLVTPLQSTATIIVSINDVNDNSPVFTYLRQTIELDETLATNVIVFDTTNDNPVIDIDVGVNMQVGHCLNDLRKTETKYLLYSRFQHEKNPADAPRSGHFYPEFNQIHQSDLCHVPKFDQLKKQ